MGSNDICYLSKWMSKPQARMALQTARASVVTMWATYCRKPSNVRQ